MTYRLFLLLSVLGWNLLGTSGYARTKASEATAPAPRQETILQELCHDNASCRQRVMNALKLRKREGSDEEILELYQRALATLGSEPTPALQVQTGRLLAKQHRYEEALVRLEAVPGWPRPPNVPADLLAIFEQDAHDQLAVLRKLHSKHGESARLQVQIGLIKLVLSLREPSYLTGAAADSQAVCKKLTTLEDTVDAVPTLSLYKLLQTRLAARGQDHGCPIQAAASLAVQQQPAAAPAREGAPDSVTPSTELPASKVAAPAQLGAAETPYEAALRPPVSVPVTPAGTADEFTKKALVVITAKTICAGGGKESKSHPPMKKWKKTLLGIGISLAVIGVTAIGVGIWNTKDQEYQAAQALTVQSAVR